MRIYLIRHGETDYNRQRIMQGHSEQNLNNLGIRQAARLGERLREAQLDHIYSSDIRRAAMTAAIISAITGVEISFDPLLRERDPGKLTHQPYDKTMPFFYDPEFEPEEGESAKVFDARVREAFAGLIEKEALHQGDGRRLGIVTHGMVCASFVRVVAGMEVSQFQALRWRNASLTIAEYTDKWHVHSLCDSSHLEEDEAEVGF